MDEPSGLTLNQVSDFLVSHSFLLSALELFQESLERGHIIPKLQDFFTTDDFISSLYTPGPETPSRPRKPKRSNLSPQTERDYQKKIKTLEYDLRQDRQNLQVLRRELQDLTLAESPKSELKNLPSEKCNLESKTLNFLVRQYLISNGYKEAAASFNQEVGDIYLSDWKQYVGELYGIDQSRFPSLSVVYKYFLKGGVNKFEFQFQEGLNQEKLRNQELRSENQSVCQELTAAQQRILELEKQVAQLSSQSLEQQKNIETQANQIKNLELKFKKVRNENFISSSPVPERQSNHSSETITDSEPIHQDQQKILTTTTETHSVETKTEQDSLSKRRRDFSSFFQAELIGPGNDVLEGNEDVAFLKDISLVEQINTIGTLVHPSSQNIVDVVSRCLPSLIKKGLTMKRREEILPLLFISIAWSSEEEQKQTLVRLLIEFITIPTDSQRQLIMDGCVWLAKTCGMDWVAKDLVPLCLEQISSPFAERRILVSDFCGKLSPHVFGDLRLSLFLSLLIQLREDNSAQVRESVVVNTARLLTVEESTDPSKKYPQIEDFVLLLLQDSVPHVSRATRHTLFPIFSNWCEVHNLFTSHFLLGLFEKIQSITATIPVSTPMDQHSSARLCLLLDLLSQSVPQLAEYILIYLIPTNHQNLISSLKIKLNEFLTNPEPESQKPKPIQFVVRSKPDRSGSEDETSSDDTSDSEESQTLIVPSSFEYPTKQQTVKPTIAIPPSQPQPEVTPRDSEIEAVEIVEVNLDSSPQSTSPTTPVFTPIETPQISTPSTIPEKRTKSSFLSHFKENEIVPIQEFFDLYLQITSLRPNSDSKSIFPFPHDNSPFLWTKNIFLPKILEISFSVNPIQNTIVTQSICSLLVKTTQCLGDVFLSKVANQMFIQKFDELNAQLYQIATTKKGKSMDKGNSKILVRNRNWLTPIYICGICSGLGEPFLKETLRTLIVHIALDENHWKRTNFNIISTAFAVLIQMSSAWIDFEFGLLWDLVVHPNHLVRSLVLKLFLAMSRLVVDEKLVAGRILPAFITLSADMNAGVRVATVSAFGELAVTTNNPTMLDKLVLQMEMMNSAGDHKMHREMAKVFGKILPTASDQLRNDFILKELLKFTFDNATQKSSKKKKGLQALFSAYSAMSGCTIPLPLQEKYILPGIECMLKDDELLESREKTTLLDMQKEIKALADYEVEKEALKKKDDDSVIDKKTQELETVFNDFSKSISTRWTLWNKDKD